MSGRHSQHVRAQRSTAQHSGCSMPSTPCLPVHVDLQLGCLSHHPVHEPEVEKWTGSDGMIGNKIKIKKMKCLPFLSMFATPTLPKTITLWSWVSLSFILIRASRHCRPYPVRLRALVMARPARPASRGSATPTSSAVRNTTVIPSISSRTDSQRLMHCRWRGG